MPITYKLYYFDARGNAEVIRLIFAQAGVKYEDIRLAQDKWESEFKPKTPYGVVPVLDIDGKIVGGAGPIARYLAKQYGLAGEDDDARLVLGGAEDALNDLRAKLGEIHFEKDETRKEAAKKQFVEKLIPRVLGGLEKLAASNKDGWFYGSNVSYVEFLFICTVEYLQMGDPAGLDKYPALKKLNESVRQLPNVAKWIKDRPETQHWPHYTWLHSFGDLYIIMYSVMYSVYS